ncbi:uncharacterized protein G2W53_007205 [Senna tora]|uniref:DUF659 domain-containing protein n=1 Tax=Senna tora TaxID=362788 RepID=A0A834X779_9FABA|nr:uncharacterized protein G2W53_007205 [Senna tora]
MSSNPQTQETNESTQGSSAAVTSVRGKTDPAWGHCKIVDDTGKKKHLICFGGQEQMMSDDVQVLGSSLPQPTNVKGKSNEKGKSSSGINSYFMPRTTPGAQPTLKSVLQSKEARERCDLAISKWMIDACLPFNVVTSPYYQPMIDAIASMGAGYKGPGVWNLRGYLLKKNVEEVQNIVNSYRPFWKQTGCTIMADGWTDQHRRTLINFLVYCPRGTVFLKSVDAFEASKAARLLYNLLREVVLYVGPENIVQVVTDNAANYVAPGKLLENEFPTLYWSPCAAHCINLMLQDIGKLDEEFHFKEARQKH